MMFANLLLCALSSTLVAGGPDKVKLTEGDKVLEGRVVFEGKDEIVLRVNKNDRRIPRSEIAEIHSLERSLAALIEKDPRNADASALASLAAECEAAGLTAEARNLWLRVLLTDPANEAAVKGAGARRLPKETKIKLGKTERNFSDLTKRQESFKQGYDLDTTHFAMRSDLDLEMTLDLAIALERFHKRFYDTLGGPLELFVFDEREDAPEVYIYGREQDFPVPTIKGDRVWFAPGINRLNVLAEPEASVATVVSELARLMLFNAMRRSAGDSAQVPSWTSHGVAQIFASAAPAERFGEWSELNTPNTSVFITAKRGDVPFERLFNATANDFVADAKRVEMMASAYTLVHYLVFANDGAMRTGYGNFLREGAKGKISLKALSESLKIPPKEIESGWRAHVDQHAK